MSINKSFTHMKHNKFQAYKGGKEMTKGSFGSDYQQRSLQSRSKKRLSAAKSLSSARGRASSEKTSKKML